MIARSHGILTCAVRPVYQEKRETTLAKETKLSTVLSRQGKLIRKFAEYLKNPRLKQGHGTLRELDDKGSKKKCCLGHLCDFYKQETGKGKWVKSGSGEAIWWVFDAEPGGTSEKLPPYPVCHLFGIDQNPHLLGNDPSTSGGDIRHHSAAGWNDSIGATLGEIAVMFDTLGKAKLSDAKLERANEKLQ